MKDIRGELSYIPDTFRVYRRPSLCTVSIMTCIYVNLALCAYGQYRHYTLMEYQRSILCTVSILTCIYVNLDSYALMGSIDMILLWSIRGLACAQCQS